MVNILLRESTCLVSCQPTEAFVRFGFWLLFFDSIVTFSFLNASLAHLTHAIFPILFHVNQITHQLCNAISVQRTSIKKIKIT